MLQKATITAPEGAYQASVRASLIFVGEYNPRKEIDYDYIEELAKSIQAQGLLQRPLCRPIEGDNGVTYELVYGQCRWLAYKVAHGDDAVIDIDVRVMTDEQAHLAALTENAQRQDPTPADEARAAARVLAYTQGDRDEAARKLGWKRSALDARLKLMACSERVLAKFGRVGTIGHAELLAALTRTEQDKLLDEIEGEGKTPTLDDLRARIQKLSKGLERAIFDKDDCANCQHNSGRQREMFASAIDDGHCTNGSCYDAKTEKELQSRVEGLQDTWQVVKILRPGERMTVASLTADGPKGVGAKQAESCKACGSYGALVSGTPEHLGRVVGSLCFNTECNTDKVTAYRNELAEIKRAQAAAQQQATGTEEASDAATTSPTLSDKVRKVVKQNEAAKGSKGSKGDGDVAPPVITLGNVVHEYRDQLYRTVLMKEFSKTADRTNGLLLALAASSRASAIDSSTVSDLMSKHAGGVKAGMSLGAKFAQAMSLDETKRAAAASRISAYACTQLTRQELTDLMLQLPVDWKEHFTLKDDFLSKLTKSEIVAVAQQLGIAKLLTGETFKTLLALKKDALIKRVLGVDGFDYVGAIPSVLLPNFKSKR